MEIGSPVPTPFLFNGLKHHRHIILQFIDNSIEHNYSVHDLNIGMKKIGNSMIDLYYGDLSPREIANEIAALLTLKCCYHKDDYTNYIFSTPKKFRSLTLSDGSNWTLLLGNEPDTYVHFHPSRGSKFSKRVKAISIKTAIMLKIFYEEELQRGDLIDLTNKVRVDCMHESPIKNESDTIRLKRVLDLL